MDGGIRQCSPAPSSKHQMRKIILLLRHILLVFHLIWHPSVFKELYVCFFCNWQEMTREHSPPFTNTSTESIPCPLSSICPSVVWLIYINRPLVAVCEGQVDVLPLQAHIFLCYEVIRAETVYRDLVQKPSLSHTHRHTQPSIK